jgi:hypothetical protein
VIIILLAVSTPFAVWQFSDSRELDVAVLDNTVPDTSYREHKGLFWVLNNQKYVESDGSRYGSPEDYYGFVPLEDYQYEIQELPDPIDADLVYIADSYGVYEREFYGENPEGARSELIYGGMASGELDKIEQAVGASTPLVAEFNTFGSPTTTSVKERLYDLLGVRWTGWIGRYFFDLTEGVEVPQWAVENHERQYGREWTFKGPGVLFADETDRIVVLVEGTDIAGGVCEIMFTDAGTERFGISDTVRYNYWFDIIELDDASSLARFSLALTDLGITKLSAFDIPAEFPAVTRHEIHDTFTYYFAGDFVDIDTIPGFFRIYGYDTIKEWTSRDTGIEENEGFFWKVYVPMMKTILAEAYEHAEGP